jgi:protein-S-isoprenylcysteine O-methyltransferase Ste14
VNAPFRPAKEAKHSWNLGKTFVQMAFFWILFLWILPMQIVRFESFANQPQFEWEGQSLVASILFSIASILGLYSGITMAVAGRGTPLPIDTARELVITGPYSRVRNPMAIAGLAQGIAVAIYFGSPAVAVYSVAGGFIWNFGVRPAEERDLQARFGESYTKYRSKVSCWIPSAMAYSG